MKIGFLSFDHLRDWTGITRLIDQLATEMVSRGHHVVIMAEEASPSKRVPVSPRAYEHELITFDLSSVSTRQAARTKIAGSGIDICATSVGGAQMPYVPWLFNGSGIPVCVGEPVDPRVISFERWLPYEHFGVLFAADAIQVLLERYVQHYPSCLQERITTIGNPLPPSPEVDLNARRNRETRTILAVGRFNESDKRFSLLLQAFALLAGEFSTWKLKMVGDGPFWDYYHLMAKQLGIAGRVIFTGSVADPETHYEGTDVFCLPSGWAEGFPMVLAEAAAHALPLVGFKTCAACEALITEGRGVLIDSPEGDAPEALAAALRSLMALDPRERERMGVQAREALQEQYGGTKVFDAWERLLFETLENTRRRGLTALEEIGSASMDKVPDVANDKRGGLKPEGDTGDNLKPEGDTGDNRKSESDTEDGCKLEGDVWDGLRPESPVWTTELLRGAAREIIAREDQRVAPETSEAPEEVESVRLRSELARLRQDYEALDRKHTILLGQFQALAGSARGRQDQRPKRKKR